MLKLKGPQHTIKGTLHLSGSKSISNRLLILDQVLGSQLTIKNLSDSEDTRVLVQALQNIREKKQEPLNVHHAGTSMRFLTTLLATTPGDWILTGSDRMKERPISELVNALKQLGAEISYPEKKNFPPLSIKGKSLEGGTVIIDGSISSQFLSALLLISPSCKNGINLQLKGELVSRPYLDMTLSLLKRIGMQVSVSQDHIQVKGLPSKIVNTSFSVESDWSSASYLYSICALSKGADLRLSSFDAISLQGDSVLPHLFEKLGVKTEFKEQSLRLINQPASITQFDYDFSDCPDLAQTLAVTCFGLGIEANLRGLKTLRIKESNRIVALKCELEKFGAIVTAGPDFLHIEHPKLETRNLKPETRNPKPETITIDTYNDHRMAMCFAPLSLLYECIQFKDPDVVKKSYPAFWTDLLSLGFSVNLQP